MSVELDAGLVEADVGGVRDAARGHQDVAALDRLLSGDGARDEGDLFS
jgi:hypothetical protein